MARSLNEVLKRKPSPTWASDEDFRPGQPTGSATLAEEEEIRRLFLDAKTITFVEDESIQPGGCIIETDLGRIDARLETRLDLMKKELLEVMEGD